MTPIRMAGKIYLVATPIGNLGDMTQRGINTLLSADVIACEDTRHSRKLLSHYGIKKPLVSYHEHNEAERATELIERVKRGDSIAVISDAGTPTINDPGYRVVQLAVDDGIEVISVPGPSAVISALAGSGLPTNAFFFGGFLPAKKGERRARLRELSGIPGTLIFFEAPHRLAAAIGDCLDELGDRHAVIARELTKVHEEFIRGDLSDLKDKFGQTVGKGEVVLMIDRLRSDDRPPRPMSMVAGRVAELEASGVDRRAALKQAAREFGMSRSDVYREMQLAKKS